jgi:hypothetical protein
MRDAQAIIGDFKKAFYSMHASIRTNNSEVYTMRVNEIRKLENEAQAQGVILPRYIDNPGGTRAYPAMVWSDEV